ncbi:zinc finger MYND domain-containing protein [Phanerochaete sordida]|uniref:Zinc finger MYND domain-containing protein n=1 Tax=Phanerochaete sordida TaxID=48140 RepID=A0A9P3LJY9_9APHY|nr:zinc finger MYND domain-containing protein [Phanerochaete sordida]
MPLFSWSHPRPDIRISRRAWEDSWDADFKRNYEPPTRVPERGAISDMQPRSAIMLNNMDGAITFSQRQEKDVLMTQVQFVRHIDGKWKKFEEEWKRASDERRMACIEEGVYRFVVAIPGDVMEMQGRWCPESSVHYLASKSGQTYLDLASSLMLPISAILTGSATPILPSHPAIDRLASLSPDQLATPGYQTLVRIYMVGRASLLTTIVKNIFLLFNGKEKGVTQVAGIASRTRLSLRETTASLGPEERKAVRTHFKEGMENMTGPALGHTCAFCMYTGEKGEPGETKKFSRCSTCHKIGRSVIYCSKECQTRDWKDGTPYPHKLVCGKLLSEQDILALPRTGSDRSAADVIPDAAPSFCRSPALNQQIDFLSKDIFVDYMVFVPDPTVLGGRKPVGVIFHLNLKPLFFLHRSRAFRNGDRFAIQIVYTLLLASYRGMPDLCGVRDIPSLVHAQLEEEFQVSISDEVVPPDVIHQISANATAEELALIDSMLSKAIEPHDLQSAKQELRELSTTPYLISA